MSGYQGFMIRTGAPVNLPYVSRYAGKRYSVLGASIDMARAASNVTDANVWHALLAQALGMSLVKNNSKSGTMMSGDPSGDQAGCGTRATDLGANPDVIFVNLIANDFAHDVPLGSYTGAGAWLTDGSTFSDSAALCLSKMKAAYPNAEIWLVNKPSSWVYFTANGGFPQVNGNGVTMEDYYARFWQIGDTFGCRKLDWRWAGPNYWNRAQYNADYNAETGKGTHFNPAGMALLAQASLRQMDPANPAVIEI